jgi:hypothetical protein
MNFVLRCFTGLCILAAVNGSNHTRDERIVDTVPKRRSLGGEVRAFAVHAA